jgi:hypothetical protein
VFFGFCGGGRGTVETQIELAGARRALVQQARQQGLAAAAFASE